MKKKPCNCPAYPFPHRRGGGRCDLPSTCDFMFVRDCLDPVETNCEYVDDCPLVASIEHMREQFEPYDTLEEKYLAEME